jgi:hypothetical protein
MEKCENRGCGFSSKSNPSGCCNIRKDRLIAKGEFVGCHTTTPMISITAERLEELEETEKLYIGSAAKWAKDEDKITVLQELVDRLVEELVSLRTFKRVYDEAVRQVMKGE